MALELGGRKVQEAAFIFQEVGDRYIWTAQLQTWRAVAKMRMNLYEEAEEFLKVSLLGWVPPRQESVAEHLFRGS